MSEHNAVVLLSGGLDSATCLALARHHGYHCYTLAFDYDQRHRVELDAAERVAQHLGASAHRVLSLGLGGIGGSSLTDARMEVPEEHSDEIPSTYVPARNTVFLSLALGLAEVVEAEAIYIGINAVDYSGYPDCRPEFLDAYRNLAEVATRAGVEGRGPRIEAPLLHWSKADIVQTGTDLGLDYGLTVSCYQADSQGRACGRCDSCRFRKAGFAEAGVPDPTPYQA